MKTQQLKKLNHRDHIDHRGKFMGSLARARVLHHGGTEGMEEKLYAAWLGRLLATKNTKGTKTTEARIHKPERSEGLVSLGC